MSNNKKQWQAAVDEAEKNGPFPSRSKLWEKVAEVFNEKFSPAGSKPVSHTVAYLRHKELALTCKTPATAVRQGPVGGADRFAKAREAAKANPKQYKTRGDKLAAHLEFEKNQRHILEQTPARFHKLAKSALKGSMKAALKLTCLGCVGFETAGVHKCCGYSCPLYLYRPYQRPDEVDGTE